MDTISCVPAITKSLSDHLTMRFCTLTIAYTRFPIFSTSATTCIVSVLCYKSTRTTSTTATLIDLFATTNPRNISRAIVAESCLSDHDMLISVRKINNLKEQPRVIKCRNYAKYDPTIFCSDLKKVPWDTVLSLANVDEAWSSLAASYKIYGKALCTVS